MDPEMEEIIETASTISRSTPDRMVKEEIRSYLRVKYNELMEKLKNLREFEENNPVMDVDECMKDLRNYKVKFVNIFAEKMSDIHPQEWKKFPQHVELDALERVRKELQDTKALFVVAKNQLEADKIELQGLEEKIRIMESISAEALNEQSERTGMNLLTQRRTKLSRVFNSHRIELDHIIDKLFPDSPGNYKTILNDLSVAFFDTESGDPYISMEECHYDYECLEILLQANIITRHPYDPKKIRLVNFLQ
ncbi:uncharacterized protein [Periplaneta americana]|uniref:uncharacterized protein isoform X1 n=1 Tax=Periplaneta americana TaxID=6978 RepID=UPI0037E8B653